MPSTGLESVHANCPYCGECIELVVDCSLRSQEYIEDCSVCCRPITVQVEQDDEDQLQVRLSDENEA